MKTHDKIIRLTKNARWIYSLDPFTGCSYWTQHDKKWCYWVCYAKKMDARWWFDFSKLVYRDFLNELHIQKIWKQIINIPFIRLWTMCDPSSDWEHTINIVKKIKHYQKNIVIITKHWTKMTKEQMRELEWVCINTSISALDTIKQISYRIKMYNEFKKYWNSILRVNTCDFIDERLKKIQDNLLINDKVIDNVLRIPKSHKLVKEWVIRVEKHKFLWSEVYASMHDKSVFFGHCDDCKEQCWITM